MASTTNVDLLPHTKRISLLIPMHKFIVPTFLLLLTFSWRAEGSVADKLEEIYGKYSTLGKENIEPRIKSLILLDKDLRTLIYEPWLIGNRSIDKKYWKEKYHTIGIGLKVHPKTGQ